MQFLPYILLTLGSLTLLTASGQTVPDSLVDADMQGRYVVEAMITEEGDTIPVYMLEPFRVVNVRPYGDRKLDRKFRRLQRHVKKVYPYAKLAGKKFDEYSAVYANFESKRDRKKYMKQIEEELKDEFGDEMKDLTITQGIILIKLIDRETQNTSYEIIKEFRGAFSAFFWQSLARLFGSDLKMQYDPEGEDKMIEDIVLMIESGQL